MLPPASPTPIADEPPNTPEAPGRVLVVDDVAANVRLLTGILKVEGFQVETASSGAEALEKLEQAAPDVLLLDVMMPEMDGFELCRRVRAETSTRRLPVVMVTALHETSDRVQALEAGADDFLSKPVDEMEVVARVRSLVRAKRDHDALETALRDLQEARQARENMTAMLVHDLRTPLTSVITGMQTLDIVGDLNPDQQEMINIAVAGGEKLLGMVNDLLDVEKLESGTMQLDYAELSAQDLVGSAMAQVAPLALSQQLQLVPRVDENLPLVRGDESKLRRILVNLLGNAIKFTPSGGSITVEARLDNAARVDDEARADDGAQSMLFLVRDTGEGIPPEAFERIFEKFGQVPGRQGGRAMSTGLGLTFCKLAVEAHGGRIWVQSVPGQGSTFHFTLPLQP